MPEENMEDLSRLTPLQRRRRYAQEHPEVFQWDEGEALTGVSRQAKQKETKQEPPKEDVNAFQKLLQSLPREKIDELIEEYGDDENFVEIATKQIAPKEDNQEALREEYQSKFAKIPAGRSSRPYEIKRLQDEMRAKGLKEL